MLDTLKSLFSKDTSELSGTETIFILIALIVAIVLFIIISRICFRMEKMSGKSAFTVVKIIMIAAAPTVFSVLAILNINVPFKWFGIITAVMCIIVAIWNILTYGILGGLFFSVVHIVLGLISGLGIAALVFIAVAAIALMIFGGASGSSVGGSSSGGAPSMVRDVNNGMTYNVVKGVNGQLYVEDNGRSCILRSSDYSGRFFDDNGNEYLSC